MLSRDCHLKAVAVDVEKNGGRRVDGELLRESGCNAVWRQWAARVVRPKVKKRTQPLDAQHHNVRLNNQIDIKTRRHEGGDVTLPLCVTSPTTTHDTYRIKKNKGKKTKKIK